jgi:hypothetical protein
MALVRDKSLGFTYFDLEAWKQPEDQPGLTGCRSILYPYFNQLWSHRFK